MCQPSNDRLQQSFLCLKRQRQTDAEQIQSMSIFSPPNAKVALFVSAFGDGQGPDRAATTQCNMNKEGEQTRQEAGE